MLWVALGVGTVLLGIWVLRLFAHADPRSIRRAVTTLLMALGVAVAVGLVATGRVGTLLWGALLLMPFAWRRWQAYRAARSFSAGQPAAESQVETPTLTMHLDHATGVMSGRVRTGPHVGRELSALSRGELLALLDACRDADAESVPLLEAWLDRAMPDWRGEASAPPTREGPMTRADAFAVLGVEEGADATAIRAAHRRLMRAAHPDQGGSAWLAARINQARDLLLD